MSIADGDGNDVAQVGKSGGDASGGAFAGAGADGGSGYGNGSAVVYNVDPIGAGIGSGGDAGASAVAGQSGGDVSDNTSIGSINIGS